MGAVIAGSVRPSVRGSLGDRVESVNRHGGGRLPRSAAGVVYGAVLAFAQTDLKRLVAYSRA